MTEDERELLKLRADYAWKWFDLHAKQRMTLFNYFLIVAGILANGILLTLKDPGNPASPAGVPQVAQRVATTLPSLLPTTSFVIEQTVSTAVGPAPSTASATPTTPFRIIRVAIGFLGFFATVTFLVFDTISRRLNSRSEDVLEELERAVL